MENQLFELAERIKNNRLVMLSLSEEMSTLRENSKRMQISIMNDISEMKDAAGKSLYSNDSKRQVAFELIASNDPEQVYNKMKNRIEILEKQISELSIEIEFDNNKLRIHEMISRGYYAAKN